MLGRVVCEVGSIRKKPLSTELSKAIGLKCTNPETTLVGYMMGIEWLSTRAVQGFRTLQVPGRMITRSRANTAKRYLP